MPDVRTLWRALSPLHPLVNARREVAEHARVSAEVEAVIARIGRGRGTSDTTRSQAAGAQSAAGGDSAETLESSARAS